MNLSFVMSSAIVRPQHNEEQANITGSLLV
jgi:hypothetical protein